jgi:hypothetical protein
LSFSAVVHWVLSSSTKEPLGASHTAPLSLSLSVLLVFVLHLLLIVLLATLRVSFFSSPSLSAALAVARLFLFRSSLSRGREGGSKKERRWYISSRSIHDNPINREAAARSFFYSLGLRDPPSRVCVGPRLCECLWARGTRVVEESERPALPTPRA